MATDEVMKNYFARFIGHEMMFMVFSSDFHGIFTNLSFIVFALRGHVTSFYENESYMILPSKKRLVGHILNKIIVIWFCKPAPFS